MIEQIFHHYTKWEDFHAGQYALTCDDELTAIRNSACLLANCPLLREMMRSVTEQWKYATEVNLTNPDINRRAWLGQAACCFRYGVPNFTVKIAWHTLEAHQQREANAVADSVIATWEAKKYLSQTMFGADFSISVEE